MAVDHLQAQGVRFAPGGIRRGASGHDVAFIHPKATAQPHGEECCSSWQAPPAVVAAYEAAHDPDNTAV